MPTSSDEQTYAANPTTTNLVQDNWLYQDGSFFGFDLPPRYVLNGWFDSRHGGVYEIPNPVEVPSPFVFKGWSHWVDKFQKDYRFSSQSDTNALATVFPEVNDPWMYTEYLYQGTGTANELTAPPDTDGTVHDPAPVGVGIVQPPLVQPDAVTRTVGPSGITLSTINTVNSQPPTIVNREIQTVFELENQWISNSTGHAYWQSELEAMGWVEQLTDTGTNDQFTRTTTQRRVVKYATPVLNSGVKLYRHGVWAKATRWGQSGDVPPRTIDLTGPKEFFNPDGLLTGRIIPQVQIQWGIPIYDPLQHPEVGEQGPLFIDQEGATAVERIWVLPETVSGPTGQPDGIFNYPTLANGYQGAGAYEVTDMPRRNTVTSISWNNPNFNNNDLIHRGCQFWVGTAGNVQCTYYSQFRDRFNNLSDHTDTYTDPAAELTEITFPPFYDTDSQVNILVSSTNNTTARNVTDLGFSLVPVIDSNGAVSGVTLTPGPIFPKSTTQGFFVAPGTQVFVRTIITSKNTPYPDPTKCAMFDGPTDADPTRDPRKQYTAAGGKCPFYSPVGPRVLHSYQAEASNNAEWNDLQRSVPLSRQKSPQMKAFQSTMMDFAALGPIGMGFPAAMGIAYAATIVDDNNSLATFNPADTSRTVITWTPETVSLGGKSVYYNTVDGLPKGNTPIQDERVSAANNFNALDDKSKTPLGGVDPTLFGLVNQANYRVMHNVQHCYRADKCDSIIKSPGGNVGWRRGRYSNINFTAHPLHMPGFPAYDGTDKYCHIGDSRCPYNRLDRRANEYNENYKILVREILKPFRTLGISGFSGFGMQEAFLVDGQLKFLGSGDLVTHPDAICVAVRPADSFSPVIGHYMPLVTSEDTEVQYRIYFYYDRPSWDPQHRSSHVSAHIVQFDDNNNAQYLTCPADLRDNWTRLFTNPDTIPWLVELYDNYMEPSGNLYYCTNSKPFAGGRSPEYRDRSKIGNQVLSLEGGYSDLSFMQGATVSNQFGGPLFNKAPVAGQIQMGYWIQEEGEWILDGRSVGFGEGFVDIKSRMKNKPAVVGHRTPVDGAPSITIQDPNAPEKNSGNADYAKVGWAYSNDTASYINFLRSGAWSAQLPFDNFTQASADITPPQPDSQFLPRERIYYQCDKCGISFPEEEVNYFANFVNYPLPSGVTSGTGQGHARVGCPRGDDGALYNKGSYIRFMDTYARGEIDVWAPPGTTVKHDGYFWKAPVFVNRVHKDQLARKLGMFNPSGGGYDFKGLGEQVEKMGRLPVTTVRSYQVGLGRQIVAPWASPGQSVAAVRQNWGGYFNLLPTDQAWVQRGVAEPIAVINEQAFVLQMNDVLQWYRTQLDGTLTRIGVPISACATAPQAILQDPSVLNDQPLPNRADFGQSPSEQRRYQDNINKWLLNCVTGTLQTFSSSTQTHPNLLSEALAGAGINPDLGKPIDPVTGQNIDLDEAIISPYTTYQPGGLKMITLKDIKELRNKIIPVLGYSLNYDTYTAGGDFTDSAQAGYQNRFAFTRKPQPMETFGTIIPQVLATSTTGIENYVEWYLNDIDNTTARAYYPTGKTWWRLNQKVGCIKRNGGTSWMHLDQPNAADNWSNLPYTGDDVVSQVLYFIHGRMPMDKEVLKAYLIYTPDDAPHMDAIGCQGQFTGNVSPPDQFNGGTFDPSAGTYKGNGYCYWFHYHGYTTNHELDNPVPYWGVLARNHVIIGHQKPSWFASQFTMNDPTMVWLLGQTDCCSDEFVSLQQIDTTTMNYKPFAGGGTPVLYTPHVTGMMGLSFEDVSHGFDLSQPYLKPWVWGQDMVQLLTEHQVWKDITYDQYNSLIDRYKVNGLARVDDQDVLQSFQYFGSYFRNFVWPREQAPIPNWVDMTGYDTSERFGSAIQISPQSVDNDWATGNQVIVAADVNATPASGGNGTNQAGHAQKVIDITDTIKKIYNDRVDRFFTCVLGASYASLYDLIVGSTDTNFGKHDGNHTGYQDPWYFWNYRYVSSSGINKFGMWLNDPWHHVPIINGVPATPGTAGDPITQTQSDMESRVDSVSGWDTQELDSSDPNYKAYHPFSLCSADAFANDLPPYAAAYNFPTPRPADSSKYWRVVEDRVSTHYFVMDLRQVPYEVTRRAWRNQAPRIDASNATCPNTACFVHDLGMTMGQLLVNSTQSWGYGVIPSLTSPYCPNCRTKLVGAIQIPGDGLTTVQYAASQLPDAVINAVEINSDTSDQYAAARHGFSVEYFNSITQQWRPLFNVSFNADTSHWEWLEWDGTQWALRNGTSLPAAFMATEGVGGVPKNKSLTGVHFIAVTGSKIRYRVIKPAVVSRQEPSVFTSFTAIANTNKIRVGTLADELPKYVGRTITLQGLFGATLQRTTAIITACTNDGTSNVFTLSVPPGAGYTTYQVTWNDYISKCSKFRVYGYPFNSGQLVITPPGTVQQIPIYIGVGTFRLNAWPSQICNVTITAGDNEPVSTAQAESTDTNEFFWTTEQDTFNGEVYTKLTGCKWFYDYTSNTISIPDVYMDDDGVLHPLWSLNDDAYNDKNNPLQLKTLPNMMFVEFITGNGAAVDVQIQSCGVGPSYQLEAESIQFISGESPDDDRKVPFGYSSDSMPTIGMSVRMKTNGGGGQSAMHWQAYNHKPIVWNSQNIRWLVGDELSRQQWGRDDLFGVYTGGLGDAVDQIGLPVAGGLTKGMGAALSGKVTGAVTLYGSPNTILSGNLVVYAKTITSKTYQTEAGPVTFSERTGGYRSGGFTFRLEITDTVQNRRTGVTAAVPQVVVYLRERQLDNDPVSLA